MNNINLIHRHNPYNRPKIYTDDFTHMIVFGPIENSIINFSILILDKFDE